MLPIYKFSLTMASRPVPGLRFVLVPGAILASEKGRRVAALSAPIKVQKVNH